MFTQNTPELKNFVSPIESRMQYGFPELKKLYKKYLNRALIFSLFLYFASIGTYIGVDAYGNKKAEEYKIKRDLELSKLEPEVKNNNEKEEIITPVEVAPVNDKGLKEMEALTPEPVIKERADIETIKKAEDLEKIKAFVSSEGDENFDPTLESKKLNIEIKTVETNVTKDNHTVKPEIIKYEPFQVDKAPVAVNLSAIQSSMRYPEDARQIGKEGTVVVRVLVGPDGSIISIGSVNGPEVFRDEVTSKIMNLQFTPALQQGQAVRCWISVPFSFKLSGQFKKDNDDKNKDDKKDEQIKNEDNK